MTHLLSNGLRNTYNKRDVDSRLRVLNEKEVSLQTTNPPTYLVAGIHVIDGYAGSGYAAGQKVTMGPHNEIEAAVAAVGVSGGILGFSYDKSRVYPDNLETINPGTVEADDNDVFDDAHDPNAPQSTKPRYYLVLPTPTSGTAARVRVVTRYAPGDYPSYGSLGRSDRHDPLVQASYMTGYVDRKLEDAVVMRFVGYVSKYDPRWPWSTTKVGEDSPQVSQKPVGSPESIVPRAGDLWYAYDAGVDPSPSSGTGAITPETAKPDTFFPWGVNSNSKALFRWDGFRWVPRNALPEASEYANGYTPERLDLWETLNIGADKNNGADGQNTGFYWLDQWKLYTFSVDETAFMHLKGDETVQGQKTFTSDITLPVKDNAASQNVTTHPASEHQVYLAGSGAETALNNHKNATTIDHPDSSVTDDKIGNRTLIAATATDAETTTASKLTVLLQSLSNRIKALLNRFDKSNGHSHNGTDSPKVAYANVTGTPGVVSKTANGLAPALPNETTTTKYLRQDGTWVVPPDNNTTYGVVSKTANGLAPILPNETTTTKYLRQDGTWVVPPENTGPQGPKGDTGDTGPQGPKGDTGPQGDTTTYSEMSGTTLGLVKLNGSYTFTGTINVPTPALPS